MLRIYAILVFTFLYQTDLNSQDLITESEQAKSWFVTGEKLHTEAKYDSSIVFLEKACRLYLEQAQNDPIMWQKWIEGCNKIGDAYWRLGKYDNARLVLDSALSVGLRTLGTKHLQVAITYEKIGIVCEEKGDYKNALRHYRTSLATKCSLTNVPLSEIAYSYLNLGIAFRRLSNYDSSLHYYDKALLAFKKSLGENHVRVGHVFVNRGNVYLEKADYDMALQSFDSALAVYQYNIDQHNLNPTHPSVGSLYLNMGRAYHFMKDYERALEYYQKSLRIYVESLGSKHILLGNVYDNIGVIYNDMGNTEKALEYALMGLAIRKSLGDDHPELYYSYTSLGHFCFRKKNYDQALKYYLLAEEIVKKNQGSFHSNISSNLIDIGDVFMEKGDHKSAVEYYLKSLEISFSLFGNKHHMVFLAYLRLSILFEKQNDLDLSLQCVQKSIIASVSDFNDTNIYINPEIHKVKSEKDLLGALRFKARLFEWKSKLNSDNTEDMRMSYATSTIALTLGDRMRKEYKSESYKLDVGKEYDQICEQSIRTALWLYHKTKIEEYQNTALTFAEKNKSGLLLNAVSHSKAKQFGGIPDSLSHLEKLLRLDLAFYETQTEKENELIGNKDLSKIQYIEEKIFSLKAKYENLIKAFDNQYPNYHALKYVDLTVSVSDIQAKLVDNTSALVEYFVGDSSLIIFVITKDHYEAISMPKDSSLEQSVLNMRKCLFNIETGEYVVQARKLYIELLKPVEKFINNKKRIYIVPDGVLNYLPFEALLSADVSQAGPPDFSKLPYFVKSHSISYFYSSALWLQQTKKPRDQFENMFVGFAPVFSDSTRSGYIVQTHSLRDTSEHNDLYADLTRSVSLNGETFSELQYTETELKNIVSLFDSHGYAAQAFLHNKAIEKEMKSTNMSRYKYVHIASHGFIDESNPKLSGIMFDQKDSTEDGVLYAGEIYNLQLNADLVVLSACESGLGRIARGEGIMSLTRGFLYSGARNVIVSLWQVRDQSTSVLMKELYKGILNGKTYSDALHDAKLSLINDKKYAYPLDWSPFVLIGR